MKAEDMYNYVMKIGPMKTISMKEFDRVRCFRCDHTAEDHNDENGCNWAFRQGDVQYNCQCDVSLYYIIMRQNKKGLEYTFDLLA